MLTDLISSMLNTNPICVYCIVYNILLIYIRIFHCRIMTYYSIDLHNFNLF